MAKVENRARVTTNTPHSAPPLSYRKLDSPLENQESFTASPAFAESKIPSNAFCTPMI